MNIQPLLPGIPGKHYKPVGVPTGYTLPFKIVNGAKVFHVIIGEVEHYFDADLRAKCRAYNGHVNSTMIEAVEGERMHIYVTNRLPNMVEIQSGDLDKKLQSLLPGYMNMGHTGMDMGKMAEVMSMPANNIPMKGAVAPSGTTS